MQLDQDKKGAILRWSSYLAVALILISFAVALTLSAETCKDKCSGADRTTESPVHKYNKVQVCNNIGKNKVCSEVPLERECTLKTISKECEIMSGCKNTGCAGTGETYTKIVSQEEIRCTPWKVVGT
jgi:hypothetical protein